MSGMNYNYQRHHRNGSGGKKQKNVTMSVTMAAVMVIVLAIAVGLYSYLAPAMKRDTIYPDVWVAGVNVGGMTKLDAEAAVETKVQDIYKSEPMRVELPDETLVFPPELTKVSLNINAAIDEAWRYGREGNVFRRAKALRSADVFKIDLKTDLSLDTDAVRGLIVQAGQRLDQETVQSQMVLDVEHNLLTITKGTSGKKLNVDALYQAVYEKFIDGDFTPLQYDYMYTEPEPLSVQSIYDQIGRTAADAYFDEKTGKIVPEQNGYGFDLPAVQQRLALAKEGEVLSVDLETIVPNVTEAQLNELYFRDVLASYNSAHVYNPNRTTNLDLACKEIDGTVIMPGKEFSFNNVVGQRTEEKGYQEATVYVNGASVGETGGGVCQVASTIYYCTLLANLKVTEREEHMYFVDYVPEGCDATIYWGQHDYRFLNNTEYPIRIDAKVENGYVKIALVGTKTDDHYVTITKELLSTTSYKVIDQSGNELILAPEYGNDVYQNKSDGEYYQLVDVVETAYTGYYYVTYRNIYQGNGTLISTQKEDSSNYKKRDRTLAVQLMSPQPDEVAPVVEPQPPEVTDPDVPGESDPVTEQPPEDTQDPDIGPEPDEYWP